MSNTVASLPAAVPAPSAGQTPAATTPAQAASSAATPQPVRPPFSPTEVAYVKSLMGVMPAQNLEILLLKTGIPLPVNLGHGADTSA